MTAGVNGIALLPNG